MDPQTQHPRTATEWAEVLANSADSRERAIAAAVSNDEATLRRLGADDEAFVREQVARNTACPPSLRASLLSDVDLVVRLKALEQISADAVVECVRGWVSDHGISSFDELAAAIRGASPKPGARLSPPASDLIG